MVRTYSKREINYMKLFKLIGLLFLILFLFSKPSHSANDETTIYEKIDICIICILVVEESINTSQ